MRAVDLRVPWGRSGDDCIQRKREATAHDLHLKRLREVRAVVDSTLPATATMRHLSVRARKKATADEEQHRIATENRLLMDKMARIMRDKSLHASASAPSLASTVVTRDHGVNEPAKRKLAERIAQENRVFARRLRELPANYSRTKMMDDHARQQRYLRNISRAHKLQQRIQAAQPLPLTSSEPASPVSVGETAVVRPGFVARTAKQVRLDVAKERNHDLPHMFSSPSAIIDDRLYL